MPNLSWQQIEAFWRDGYLMVDDAVTPAQLQSLRHVFGIGSQD